MRIRTREPLNLGCCTTLVGYLYSNGPVNHTDFEVEVRVRMPYYVRREF